MMKDEVETYYSKKYVQKNISRNKKSFERVFSPVYYKKEVAEERKKFYNAKGIRKIKGNFVFRYNHKLIKRKIGYQVYGLDVNRFV